MTYGPIPSLLSSMTCRGHLLSSPNHSKERIAFHRSPPPCIFLSPSSLSPLSLLPHQNQLPARIQPCRAAAPRAALQAQQRRPPAPRRPPARAPEARRDDARADPRRATEAAATGAPSAARPAPSPTASPVVHLFPAISANHCDRFFFSVILSLSLETDTVVAIEDHVTPSGRPFLSPPSLYKREQQSLPIPAYSNLPLPLALLAHR
jgi:hypothetical protein